jgi:hypothetical protein
MSGVATRVQTPAQPAPAEASSLQRRSAGLLQRQSVRGTAPQLDGPGEECAPQEPILMRRAAGSGGPALVPPIVQDVLRSPGQPLDPATQAFFEPRFGHDFARVRVHHDAQSAASAHAVDAMAYTVGSHIVFAAGHYAPGSPGGRGLIAHELTHVVQQQAAPAVLRRALRIGPSNSWQEQEADRTARALLSFGAGADRDGTIDPGPGARAIVGRAPGAPALLQRAVMPVADSDSATGLGVMGPSTSDRDAAGTAPAAPAPPQARRPAAPAAQPPPTTAPSAAPPSAEGQPARTPETATEASDQSGAAVPGGPRKEIPHPPPEGEPAEGKAAEAVGAEAAPAEGVAEKAAAPEAKGGKAAPGAKAPASPKDDPAFQAVAGRVQAAGTTMKGHAPAPAKANEAQAAAVSPPAEQQGRADAAQAAAIDREQPKPFDRDAFIKALMDKIAAIAPKTLGEADEFKKSGKVASIKGDLSKQAEASKSQAQGDIPGKVQQAPDPSGIPPKPVTPLPPTDAGPAPPDVGAGAAVPKPRTDGEISLQEGSEALDHQMSAAKVTDEQLEKANEPTFQGALDAKKTAQADAVQAPKDFRQTETGTLGQAQAEAQTAGQKQLQTMHGGRAAALEKVAGHQVDTKGQDEQARAQVAGEIQKRYDDTKSRAEARLKRLDTDVDAAFEKGATEAQQAFDDEVAEKMDRYKDDRYGGLEGPLLWVKDKLLGLPDEVNTFYEQARDHYIKRMTALLNSIAGIVETGLNETKAIIAEGRKSIDDYLKGLPDTLQAIGREAAQGIQAKFDELEHSVDEKQNELIDSLAQKYTEKVQQIDDKIAEMKKANGGLVDAAKEAIAGVIDTIINLKNMLMNVLAKASAAIDLIIADPIGFLGNLVAAAKQGFLGFVDRIGLYLEQGLMGWLFGALEGAGIELPRTFDLKGIIGLILQVLGLTYANIRARAVKILGEKVVSTLETVGEIFKTLITEGPAGLWRWIKEKVSDLKDAVLSSIKDWVITKVITAGVTWIISLLNPASAFIKACKAIYDVVMFFIERGQQILALVNAILDSIISIAKGNIAGAAAYVESVLAKAVPVAISFLASLLGLGGISEKIRAIIEKIRAPINAVIDWVIHKAVDLVKAVGKLLGFGKEKEEKPDERTEAEKQADLHAAMAKASALLADYSLTDDVIKERLVPIKTEHRLIRLELVVKPLDEANELAHIEGANSPGEESPEVKKPKESKFYVINPDGTRVLRERYQGSFKIRTRFYYSNRRYPQEVYDARDRFLNDKANEDPNDSTRWLEKQKGKLQRVSVAKTNVTVGHNPQVATHWNTLGGNNTDQQTRVNWFTFVGRMDKVFFQSREENSRDQSGEEFTSAVGTQFRGPGEDGEE